MADRNTTIERNIDRFDDIFHGYGDDYDDEDEYMSMTYGNPMLVFDSDYENKNYDYHLFLDPMNSMASSEAAAAAVREEEEVHLAEIVSQYSTFPKNLEEEIQTIPKYLTKSYKAFDELIHDVIRKSATLIHIEYLRDLAFLLHQIESIKLNQLLWTIYLQSGTGELKLKRPMTGRNADLKIFFWPDEVKQNMIACGHIQATDSNPIDHESYIDYVNKVLENFQNQLLQYQSQIEQIKQKLNPTLTIEIEQMIVKFVQDYGISLLKIPIESLISTVEYDYKDRLLEYIFENENPNEFQIEIFKNIFKAKLQKEISKFEAGILKQRLSYNHLPNAFQSIDIPIPLALNTIQDCSIRQRLQDRAEKLLQQTKCNMILVYLAVAETNINESRINFDKLMSEMSFNQKSATINRKLNETMLYLMEERFKNINEHLIGLYRLKLRFFRQSVNGQELDLVHRCWNYIINDNKTVHLTCSPSLIQHTSQHQLTNEHRKFLNRGPTYVPPCQIHILSKSSITLAEILTKQMAPLRRDLTKLFTKYPLDLARRMNFEKEIQQLFHQSFLQPVPMAVEQRAIYEKTILQEIKSQLTKNHLILRRTADNNNTFYLGQLNEFEQKTFDYMQKFMSTYEFIGTVNENLNEQFYINKIMEAINNDLTNLVQRKSLSKDLQVKFTHRLNKNLQLPRLYFLPDLNQTQDSMLVQPKLSSFQSSPIFLIADYLEQLLQPFFENYSQSTTFLSEHDFIQKLESYCTQQHLLQPTTNFATFTILHLSTNLKHSTLLQTLNKFLLNRSITGRYGKLSSETIEELTAIILRNLFFIYHDKIYRYIKGYAENLLFLELLTNIYLHDWQLTLVREFRLRDLFYGRYQNMGFLTWNDSPNLLPIFFEKVQKSFDTNIKLITCRGTSIKFLQIEIENRQGSLYTHVLHDQSCQQLFLLPYTKEHPRIFYRQWFRLKLIRAGLYCSSLEDFEEERRYIEATFLANGYSLDFVEYHLREFYTKFCPLQQQEQEREQQQQQFILTKLTYTRFRRELFRFIEQEKIQIKKQLELERNHQLIHLYYLFDWGLRCQFNRKFYELWSSMIEQDPQFKKYALKIQLHTKHCYSSNTFLVRTIT